jgi:hypothetical protein
MQKCQFGGRHAKIPRAGGPYDAAGRRGTLCATITMG